MSKDLDKKRAQEQKRKDAAYARLAKLNSPEGRAALNNPVSKAAIRITARKDVVDSLSQGSTDDQVHRLDELVSTNTVPSNRMKSALMSKAPEEMDKAIAKYRKNGTPITVETLCAEAKGDRSFVALCSRVGLEMSFFEKVARERISVAGLEVK